MTIDELKSLIEKDIEATKEYEKFLKEELKPMINAAGYAHYEYLHFVNLGYQLAMDKIKALLGEVNELD